MSPKLLSDSRKNLQNSFGTIPNFPELFRYNPGTIPESSLIFRTATTYPIAYLTLKCATLRVRKDSDMIETPLQSIDQQRTLDSHDDPWAFAKYFIALRTANINPNPSVPRYKVYPRLDQQHLHVISFGIINFLLLVHMTIISLWSNHAFANFIGYNVTEWARYLPSLVWTESC